MIFSENWSQLKKKRTGMKLCPHLIPFFQQSLGQPSNVDKDMSTIRVSMKGLKQFLNGNLKIYKFYILSLTNMELDGQKLLNIYLKSRHYLKTDHKIQ